MGDLITVGEGNFEQEVLQAAIPVLVDFTAPWCGPCKQLDPVVKQLAQDWGAAVKVCKLNVDDSPDLTGEYGVMGVPALLLFVHGQPVVRLSGYQPKERILAKLQPHLN